MNTSVNVVMMTAMLLCFSAVAVVGEDVQPSFTISDKTETTLNINEQVSRSNGRTRRAYRQAVLRRDRRVARFVARLRWSAFQKWSADHYRRMFGYAESDFVIRDSAESVSGKRYAMFYVNGARPFMFRIKSFDGRLYYKLCGGEPTQVTKEMIASRKRHFKERGVKLSIRVTGDSEMWLDHKETGTYGRGPIRSVDYLYEKGYEIDEKDRFSDIRYERPIRDSADIPKGMKVVKCDHKDIFDGIPGSDWDVYLHSPTVGRKYITFSVEGSVTCHCGAQVGVPRSQKVRVPLDGFRDSAEKAYRVVTSEIVYDTHWVVATSKAEALRKHDAGESQYDPDDKEYGGQYAKPSVDDIYALVPCSLFGKKPDGETVCKTMLSEVQIGQIDGIDFDIEERTSYGTVADDFCDYCRHCLDDIRDSKICYVETKFRQKSMDIIDQANEIIAEYQADGMSLTLRQLYYQFVARDLIENTMRSYKRMGDVINKGRLAGLIDWNAIEDRTRSLYGIGTKTGPWSAIRQAVWSYHEDRWENQPVIIEAWIEKEALSGVISRICSQYQVDYFACKGYVSQSELHGAAMRHRRYESDGKKVIVLHLGDHDPSGMDMTRDIEDRLSLFGASTEVRRIALNNEQVIEYQPPPNPAKTTDSRSTGYIEEFGEYSWELDALEPRVLRDLIEAHVLAERDEEQWEIDEAAEQASKDQLEAISDNYHEVIRFLQDENYLIRDSAEQPSLRQELSAMMDWYSERYSEVVGDAHYGIEEMGMSIEDWLQEVMMDALTFRRLQRATTNEERLDAEWDRLESAYAPSLYSFMRNFRSDPSLWPVTVPITMESVRILPLDDEEVRDSADSASLESLQARAEALARWCGPEAVQKGERDLETVDFMPYMIKSHELIQELLGMVENAVDADPFGRLPNWYIAEDGTKVWPDTIRDSDYSFKTESGHEVNWDDGSICITFAEGTVYHHHIDDDGEMTIKDRPYISGEWYGGYKESPDQLDLSVVTINKDGKWVCDWSADKYEEISIFADDLEEYGVCGSEQGKWATFPTGLPADLLDALEESVAWFLADFEDKTTMTRIHIRDSAEKALSVEIHGDEIRCPRCDQFIAYNNGSPAVMWMISDHADECIRDSDFIMTDEACQCLTNIDLLRESVREMAETGELPPRSDTHIQKILSECEAHIRRYKWESVEDKVNNNHLLIRDSIVSGLDVNPSEFNTAKPICCAECGAWGPLVGVGSGCVYRMLCKPCVVAYNADLYDYEQYVLPSDWPTVIRDSAMSEGYPEMTHEEVDSAYGAALMALEFARHEIASLKAQTPVVTKIHYDMDGDPTIHLRWPDGREDAVVSENHTITASEQIQSYQRFEDTGWFTLQIRDSCQPVRYRITNQTTGETMDVELDADPYMAEANTYLHIENLETGEEGEAVIVHNTHPHIDNPEKCIVWKVEMGIRDSTEYVVEVHIVRVIPVTVYADSEEEAERMALDEYEKWGIGGNDAYWESPTVECIRDSVEDNAYLSLDMRFRMSHLRLRIERLLAEKNEVLRGKEPTTGEHYGTEGYIQALEDILSDSMWPSDDVLGITRDSAIESERGELGEASMHISLSQGRITVTHGKSYTLREESREWVLREGMAEDGTWDAIWQVLREKVRLDTESVFEGFIRDSAECVPDSCHWAVQKYVDTCEFPPSEEQMKILNDWAYGLEYWLEDDGWPAPKIGVFASAGSGKTKGIMEPALIIAGHIESSLDTRATAFNVHIAAELKALIQRVRADYGFSGAKTIGQGNNTVNGAGYALLRDHYAKQGIAVEYDGLSRDKPFPIGDRKDMVIPRVVLVENMTIAGDGGKAIYRLASETKVLGDKGSFRGYFRRIVNDLATLATVLKNQGFNPLHKEYDSGEEMMEVIKHIIMPQISRQGLHENVILTMGKVGMRMLLETMLYHAQLPRDDTLKEFCPFSHRQYVDLMGFPHPMGEWVIPAPSQNCGNGQGKYDTSQTTVREIGRVVNATHTNVAVDIGLFYPPRSKFAKTKKVTVTDNKPSCALYPIEGMINEFEKYNGMLRVEFSQTGGNQAYARSIPTGNTLPNGKPEKLKAADYLWKCVPGHVNGKRFGGKNSDWINPLMNALGIKQTHEVDTHWLRIMPNDPAVVEKLRKAYDGGGKTFLGPDEAKEEYSSTSSRGTLVLAMSDMTWLPNVYDLQAYKKWDICMIDEVQDLSPNQANLLWRCCDLDDDRTAVLMVGDSKQAIYLFAGSGPTAMTENANRIGAKLYPMTVTWRQSVKAAESCRSMCEGASKIVKNTWKNIELPDYNDHNSPAIKEWRQGAGNVTIDISQIPDAIEHLSQSPTISLTEADKTFAVISRTNGPLASVMKNLISRGIPVSTPSGQGGIVSEICNLLKKEYKDKLYAKNHKQGFGMLYVDSKGKKYNQYTNPSNGSKDALIRSLSKRCEQVLDMEWEQAVRRANGDQSLASRDEGFIEIDSIIDLVETLLLMWVENQYDKDGFSISVDAFRSWCKNDLFSAEGDGCHVTSVHRYKGAQNSVSFILRGYPTQDKDGKPTVTDPFLRPFLIENSPESAIEEANILYVAGSRSKDQNIIVSVLDEDDDGELPSVAKALDDAWGVDPEVVEMIRDSAERVCECCGTNQGIRLNGGIPYVQDVCGPSTDCAVNKLLRELLHQHVPKDMDGVVCKALGITSVIRDSALPAKSTKTLEMIDTVHEDWGYPDYIVKEELRNVRVPCVCPDCHGRKTVYRALTPINASTEVTPRWKGDKQGYRDQYFRVVPRFTTAESLLAEYVGIDLTITKPHPYNQRNIIAYMRKGSKAFNEWADKGDLQCGRFTEDMTEDEVKLWLEGDEGLSEEQAAKNKTTGYYGVRHTVAREAVEPGWVAMGYKKYETEYMGRKSDTGRCRTCTSRRAASRGYNRGRHGVKGYVEKVREMLCDVHYPAWPENTTFDSRFHRHDCELCGKNGIKSSTYPILAKRADGTHEGMYVGNACIQKMGWKKFKSLTDLWVKKSRYSGIELSPSKPKLYPRTYETHDVDLEESADTWMLPELTPQEANLLLSIYRNGEADLTNSGAVSKSEIAMCGQEEALKSLVKRGLVEIDTGWGIDEPRHHWLYMGRNLNDKMFDRLMWRYEQESAFIMLVGCIEDYRGNPVDAGEITESAKAFLKSVGRMNSFTDEIIRDSAEDLLEDMIPTFTICTEDMDGEEITFMERILLEDGNFLLVPVTDVIQTMTHPLNGRTVTAPTNILAKIFVRWDVGIGHEQALAHMKAEMGKIDPDTEDDSIRDSTYEYLDKRTRRPSDGLPTWSEILNLAPLTFRDDGLSDALKMVYRIEKAGHGDSVEGYLLELLIDERYNRLELIGKAFDISLIHPHNRMYSYQGWETWPCQSLAIRDSAQYVDITRDEFEDFIVDAQGFVCIDPSEYKEKRIGQFCRECVYEYPLTEEGRQIGSIRIYSSIPANNPFVMTQGQSKSRGKGKDAIRCLIVNEQGWPTKKFSHTKRVKNWRLNLMRKYEPTLTESEGHVQ